MTGPGDTNPIPKLTAMKGEDLGQGFSFDTPTLDEYSLNVATFRLVHALEGAARGKLRPGLVESPERVAKAWKFWTSGYDADVASLIKVFEDGAEGVDQMIIEVDIPFYSQCEHHLAPFFGLASVAYIPKQGKDGRVLGLSKMNRLVDVFARRLQVQERLTNQIADAMVEHVDPLGVGVLLRARHMCVESRGVQHRGCSTTTSALRGVMKDEAQTRAEFMALARTSTPI